MSPIKVSEIAVTFNVHEDMINYGSSSVLVSKEFLESDGKNPNTTGLIKLFVGFVTYDRWTDLDEH